MCTGGFSGPRSGQVAADFQAAADRQQGAADAGFGTHCPDVGFQFGAARTDDVVGDDDGAGGQP